MDINILQVSYIAQNVQCDIQKQIALKIFTAANSRKD